MSARKDPSADLEGGGRKSTVGGTVRSSARGPRLIVDIDLSDDYLSGTVTAGQQPDRPFTGRLGLLSAIEAEITRLSGAAPEVDGIACERVLEATWDREADTEEGLS
jgi:hypothetical protein